MSRLVDARARLVRWLSGDQDRLIDEYAAALRESIVTEIEDEVSFLRDAYGDTIARLAFDLVEARIRRRLLGDDADDPPTPDRDDEPRERGDAWSGGFASNH